jgi:hypothetical protein
LKENTALFFWVEKQATLASSFDNEGGYSGPVGNVSKCLPDYTALPREYKMLQLYLCVLPMYKQPSTEIVKQLLDDFDFY